MKPSQRALRSTAIILATGTAALTLFRLLAYLLNLDPTIGYFRSEWIPTLLYIAAFLLCIPGSLIAFLASPRIPRKKREKKTPEQRREHRREQRAANKQRKKHLAALKKAGIPIPPTPLPYLNPPADRKRTPAALAADLACAVSFLIAAIPDLLLFDIPLYRVRAILALLSIIAFAAPRHGHTLARTAQLTTIAPVAWCIMTTAIEYFNWNEPMNGPSKVYLQFALCLAALYLNAQARYDVVDFTISRRNASLPLVIVFGISCGIPGLITTLTGHTPLYLAPALLICATVGVRAALCARYVLSSEPATIVVPTIELPPIPQKANPADNDKEENPA